MVNPAQVESESDGDDAYHKQRTVNIKLVTANQDSLSENIIAEIDAWARQSLAANGFGDY
jgi:hypothetical protein